MPGIGRCLGAGGDHCGDQAQPPGRHRVTNIARWLRTLRGHLHLTRLTPSSQSHLNTRESLILNRDEFWLLLDLKAVGNFRKTRMNHFLFGFIKFPVSNHVFMLSKGNPRNQQKLAVWNILYRSHKLLLARSSYRIRLTGLWSAAWISQSDASIVWFDQWEDRLSGPSITISHLQPP